MAAECAPSVIIVVNNHDGRWAATHLGISWAPQSGWHFVSLHPKERNAIRRLRHLLISLLCWKYGFNLHPGRVSSIKKWRNPATNDAGTRQFGKSSGLDCQRLAESWFDRSANIVASHNLTQHVVVLDETECSRILVLESHKTATSRPLGESRKWGQTGPDIGSRVRGPVISLHEHLSSRSLSQTLFLQNIERHTEAQLISPGKAIADMDCAFAGGEDRKPAARKWRARLLDGSPTGEGTVLRTVRGRTLLPRVPAWKELTDMARDLDARLLHVIRDLTTAPAEDALAAYQAIIAAEFHRHRLSPSSLLRSLENPAELSQLALSAPPVEISVRIGEGFKNIQFQVPGSGELQVSDPDLLWDCACETPPQQGHPQPRPPCPIHGHLLGQEVTSRFRKSLVEIEYRGLRVLWRSGAEFFPPSVDTIRMVEDLEMSNVLSRHITSVLDLGCGTGMLGLFVAKHCSSVQRMVLADWVLSPVLYSALNVARNRGLLAGTDLVLKLGLNTSWQAKGQSGLPCDLALCNPSYLPALPGFHDVRVSTTVAGTDLLQYVIREHRRIGKMVVVSFSHLAMPEAEAAAQESKSRLEALGPAREVPFRNPYAFERPDYLRALTETRGLRIDAARRHRFWHLVQTFLVR